MTKPMYCPMSFCNPELSNTRGQGRNTAGITPVLCTPDCAWAVIHEKSDGTKEYGCVVADGLNCAAAQTRPLKDDTE